MLSSMQSGVMQAQQSRQMMLIKFIWLVATVLGRGHCSILGSCSAHSMHSVEFSIHLHQGPQQTQSSQCKPT